MPEEGEFGVLGLCVLAVEGLGEDPHAAMVAVCRGPKVVLSGKEHGAGGEHDGRVVGAIDMIEGDEVVDGELHEGVFGAAEDQVIGYTNGNGMWEDDIEVEQGVQRPLAADVQIQIDAAVVVENKVSLQKGK